MFEIIAAFNFNKIVFGLFLLIFVIVEYVNVFGVLVWGDSLDGKVGTGVIVEFFRELFNSLIGIEG